MSQWITRGGIAALLIIVAALLLTRVPPNGIGDAQDQTPPVTVDGSAPLPDSVLFQPPPSDTDTARQVPDSVGALQLSYAPIVKIAAPAVVNVYATQTITRTLSDPFSRFFDQFSPNYGGTRQSLGSGVIVDPAGIVVTNVHVIDEADEIRVALNDGRELSARLILADAQSDLAVLRLDGAGPFPYLALGDSEALEVGDLVLAIGNPFGVGQTVTSGIVSGIARTISAEGKPGYFIQTDAAINPGNSGGALIDMDGRLIGINTAIYSNSGGSDGIGFATPSDLVRVVAAAAAAGRPVARPWTGATFAALDADTARQLGLSTVRGVLVTAIASGSPAATAGLRVNDVIREFDGRVVDDPTALAYRLTAAGTGGQATLSILRSGRSLTLGLPLAVPPETVPRDQLTLGGASPVTGAVVANLSPAVASELGFTGDPDGVIVVAVPAGTTAARIGLEAGDVIKAINDVTITGTRQLDQMSRQSYRLWQLDILRDGRLTRSIYQG